jgi:predicted metal-dependent peptidase
MNEENKSNKEFNLNMHMVRLLMDEPFFAAVSRGVEKRANISIPTAGVCVNPKTAQFEMLYNPKFFATLSDSEMKDVLKHEFYHIVLMHVTDRLPANVQSDKRLSKLWNYATDLAINSHLSNLPDIGVLKPGSEPFEHMPPYKSAEWYFNELKQDFPSADSEGDGSPGDPDMGTLDDHSGWGQVSDEAKEVARERVKSMVQKAASEAAKANSWGSVSAGCRDEILKGLRGVIDWKKVLRYFVKTSQKSSRKSSIRRINKRYPYIHSGKKSDRVAKVAISIDQSGSVSDGMLSAFFAELNKLSSIAEFTVVPFDTEVINDEVFVWKKGESRKWQRVAHGGTCFDAPTKWVNDRNFDGHIVLTDMMAPKPIPSKSQRMWITTEYYANRPYFSTKEKIVAIPSKDM